MLHVAGFNLYGEWLAEEALEDIGDFAVGDRKINTIKYGDDLLLHNS